MTTNIDLMSVYELATNLSMSDSAKAAVKAAIREQCSFNRVIKDMKCAAIYPLLSDTLAKVGVNSKEELSVAKVKGLIAPELQKSVMKKVDGEEKEQTVICTIRKRYETVSAFVCDESGRKLCKVVDGKAVPRTQKVVKLDELGEKVIKDYELCEVHTWTIQTVLNLLAQSKIIREGVK